MTAAALHLPFAPPGTDPAPTSADRAALRPRRIGLAAVVIAHVAVVWGLLQMVPTRLATRPTRPLVLAFIAPASRPPAPIAAPTPVRADTPAARPATTLTRARPATPTLAVPAAIGPTPAAFELARPATESATTTVAAAAPAPPAAPAASAPPPSVVATATATAPRTLAPSDVQYLVEPAPAYPRASARNRESGRVLVRVLIDEAGMPGNLQLARSSGFARLDEAAMTAVAKSRFRPPTLAGVPVSGWAQVPIDFGLERAEP